MKLMFCERCGELVVPSAKPRQYRPCYCGHHAVWWEDPQLGILRVYDATRNITTRTMADPEGEEYEYTGPPDGWASTVWIIGLHNQWMMHQLSGRKAIDAVLSQTPDSYIFKRDGSIAIKIRPGQSSDTAYDDLPAGWGG